MAGWVFAVVFVIALLTFIFLPFLRVIGAMRVNQSADRFTGVLSGWKITTASGRVLSASIRQEQFGVGGVSGTAINTFGSTSFVGSGPRIINRTYNEFRLQLPNGTQEPFSLVNFNAQLQQGDLVTVASASKGRKSFTFAILDHTTSSQYFNDVSLHSISGLRNKWVFLLWFWLGCLSLIGLPVVFSYIFLERRQRNRFSKKGVAPLWRRASAELGTPRTSSNVSPPSSAPPYSEPPAPSQPVAPPAPTSTSASPLFISPNQADAASSQQTGATSVISRPPPVDQAPQPPSPPPGWYPDPHTPVQRYWDGRQWTEHTAPLTTPN